MDVKCPIDQEVTKKDEIVFLTEKQAGISQLLVHCFEIECEWVGTLNEFASHFQGCDFKHMDCVECNQTILVKDSEDHFQSLCENRLIVCEHCALTTAWKSREAHEAICFMKTIECPNGCKQDDNSDAITIIKQVDREKHVESECIERRMPCPFAESNCDKNSKYKRMKQHLVKYSIIHLNGLGTYGQDYLRILESQARILLNLKEQMKVNERKLADMSADFGAQLLWKIENINEKYHEALSGVNAEIVSEPFFSISSYGYKFIVRLVFNVANARITGQYISVFISICDSPFNALLAWPFKQKINFHLINQETDKHISHLLTPNAIKENFPFINRPTTERNPFFGIEKFAKCNIFYERSPFIVNNTIYLRVVVEPHEIA